MRLRDQDDLAIAGDYEDDLDYEAVIPLARRALSLLWDPVVARHLLVSLDAAKRLDEGREVAERLVREEPEDPLNWLMLAGVRLKAGKTRDARKILSQITYSDKLAMQLAYTRASLAIHERRWSDAIDEYRSAISVSLPGELPMLFASMALVYERQRKYVEAEQQFECGLDIDSAHVRLLVRYAKFLQDRKQTVRALMLMDRARSLAPRHMYVAIHASDLYATAGMVPDAIQVLKEMAEHYPDTAYGYEVASHRFWAIKQYDEAILAAKRVLSMDRKCVSAYAIIVKSQFALRKYRECWTSLRSYLKAANSP